MVGIGKVDGRKDMLKNLILLVLSTLFSSVSLSWDGFDYGGDITEAMELTPDIEHGKKLYQTCAHCHTETGWGMAPGIGNFRSTATYTQIAGQHQPVLIKQLLDIRNLNRDNPSMYPFSTEKYLGGAQNIADVTGYITSMPTNNSNQNGDGRNLEHGKSLYTTNCSKCHGENGEGDSENFYPKLAHQHYEYMLRQFIWIKDGKRRNANPKMVKQIQGFKFSDIKAVIDYASRLGK